jgi:hypothetical protein
MIATLIIIKLPNSHCKASGMRVFTEPPELGAGDGPFENGRLDNFVGYRAEQGTTTKRRDFAAGRLPIQLSCCARVSDLGVYRPGGPVCLSVSKE